MRIDPAAGGQCRRYGESPDVNGPATMSFPDGAGPVDLVVTASANLVNPSGTIVLYRQ